MVKITRRSWMKRNIAVAAAGGAASVIPATAQAKKHGEIRMAMVFGDRNAEITGVQQRTCLQMGVHHAIAAGLAGRMPQSVGRDQYAAYVQNTVDVLNEQGFVVSGCESGIAPNPNVRRGTKGREEEVLNYIAGIEAMGKAGIPMLCYNFGPGGFRTNSNIVTRGGAITSEFDYEDSKKLPASENIITEEELWDNFAWFMERIIPAAEKANVKLALHPDDPPVSPLRGTAQIFNSADSYRKMMKMFPSPVNGITWCHGNFRAMGEQDIYSVAREFTEMGKVFFIHLRDVDGTADTKFTETFHDNGPTDLAKLFEIFSRSGFDGPIRPDHAPTMEGEDPGSTHGYGLQAKIFAFGYFKGIFDAYNINYD